VGEERYKKYIVVFLDILGFQDKIREAGNDPSKILSMADLLDAVKEKVIELHQGIPDNPHLKVRIFSDTIVLSCLDEGEAFLSMVPVISLFQASMAQQGHFLRGGIVAGDHLEKNYTIFGPAIIQAYKLEKLAIWPRVVIHASVWSDFKPKVAEWVKGMTLLPSPDGLTYLNYLQHAFIWTVEEEWKSEYRGGKISFPWPTSLDMFDAHKNAILNRAKASNVRANIDVLTKYHSLAEYHNMVAEIMCKYLSFPIKGSDPILPTPAHALHIIGAVWAEEFQSKAFKDDSEEKRKKFWESKMAALSKKCDLFLTSRIDLIDTFPDLYLRPNRQP